MWRWMIVVGCCLAASGESAGGIGSPEQVDHIRTKIAASPNKSSKYEETKVSKTLQDLDPELLNVVAQELYKIQNKKLLVEIEKTPLNPEVNKTEDIIGKEHPDGNGSKIVKQHLDHSSTNDVGKEKEYNLFRTDLRTKMYHIMPKRQKKIFGANDPNKKYKLENYFDHINEYTGQNVKVFNEDYRDAFNIKNKVDEESSDAVKLGVIELSFVPKRLLNDENSGVAEKDNIQRNVDKEQASRYARIFRPMPPRNTYYSMRNKLNHADHHFNLDLARKKRAATNEDHGPDADCQHYKNNLDYMWRRLAKIVEEREALPNKEHLHNIAQLIKTYLDQQNAQTKGNVLPNHNADRIYETVIKPLLLRTIKLLKRYAPPGDLVDEILKSLRSFFVNHACRKENIQLVIKSFTSAYEEYATDTKSCHYHIEKSKSFSSGSQTTNSIETRPSYFGKLFEREGLESNENANEVSNTYKIQNQVENDNLRIKNVLDDNIMLNSNPVNNGTHGDNSTYDYKVSDAETRDLTSKISSLLTGLQVDRTKRSTEYKKNENESAESFLQFCKSYVLKRFLDSITFIVQRYIENIDCKNDKKSLTNFDFEGIDGNKAKGIGHTDALSDVTENINDLLAQAKFPTNNGYISKKLTLPLFETNSDSLTDRFRDMEKLMHLKNDYGDFNAPKKIPGAFDDQTLLYIKAAKDSYNPDLIKLVDAAYKPNGDKTFQYPKGSLNYNIMPLINQQSAGLVAPANIGKTPNKDSISNVNGNPFLNDEQHYNQFLSNDNKLTDSSNLNKVIQNNAEKPNLLHNLNKQRGKSSNSFNYQFQKKTKNTIQNEENFRQSELLTLLERYLNENISEKDAERSLATDNDNTIDKIAINSGRDSALNTKLFASKYGRLRNSQLLDVLSKLGNVPTIELPAAKDSGPEKNVELTYIVRQPQVFLYQPQVIVKQRLKYENFLRNINNILNSMTISSNNRVQLQKVVKLFDTKQTVLYETTNSKSPIEVMDATILEEKIHGEKCKKNKANDTDKENESTKTSEPVFSLRQQNPFETKENVNISKTDAHLEAKKLELANSTKLVDLSKTRPPFDAKKLVDILNSNATATEKTRRVNTSGVTEEDIDDEIKSGKRFEDFNSTTANNFSTAK